MKPVLSRIKIFSFWHFQIAGWSLFYAAELFLIFTVKHIPLIETFEEVVEFAAGFLLTSLLRLYYRKIQLQRTSIPALILRILASSVILAFLWVGCMIAATFALLPNLISVVSQPVFVLNSMVILVPVIIGWSSMYFGIKFWLELSHEKERTDHANSLAQQAQLQMLRYQLNPHFMFNTLNSIRALIDEDVADARAMITELSEFLRYSLVNRNRTDITLKEEIEAIRLYVAIEKKRYEDKLEVTFRIDEDAESSMMLSFLIHPIVENAIKFGMQSSSMPVEVDIEAKSIDSGLRITVTNTGKWQEHSTGEPRNGSASGNSLKNVRMRLEKAFPGRHSVKISEINGRVHVIIDLHASANGQLQAENDV